MSSSVYSRTFVKAAELVGGRAKLCRELRVPASELEKWIDGKGVPPIGMFLKAVDIVISETPAPGGGSPPDDTPAPRDCSPGDSPTSRY